MVLSQTGRKWPSLRRVGWEVLKTTLPSMQCGWPQGDWEGLRSNSEKPFSSCSCSSCAWCQTQQGLGGLEGLRSPRGADAAASAQSAHTASPGLEEGTSVPGCSAACTLSTAPCLLGRVCTFRGTHPSSRLGTHAPPFQMDLHYTWAEGLQSQWAEPGALTGSRNWDRHPNPLGIPTLLLLAPKLFLSGSAVWSRPHTPHP